MQEHIKRVTTILKTQYIIFWLIPIAVFLCFEADLLPTGIYVGDGAKQYVWETLGVLLAIVCVPLSLKLFSFVLRKKIDALTFPVALSKYCFWSGIRLSLLEVTVLFNLVIYFMTLNSIGGLCAMIGLTASLFCLPSEKRLREELNIARFDTEL